VQSIGWRYLLSTLNVSVPIQSLTQGIEVASSANDDELERQVNGSANGDERPRSHPDVP
jgi:hypothetical protein